jgi:hypothetical protein
LQFFSQEGRAVATISINLSQSAFDAENADQASEGENTLAELAGIFFLIDRNFAATHPVASYGSTGRDDGRMDYADGGYTSLSSVMYMNPGSSAGMAVASHVETYFPNNYRLAYDGSLAYSYQPRGDNIRFDFNEGTFNRMALTTLLPASDPNYPATTGNETFTVSGRISVPFDHDFAAHLDELKLEAERVIRSSTITGSFDVSGNTDDIGRGLATASFSGTLTGVDEQFYDGSHVTFTGLAIPTTGATPVDESLLADPDNLPADDVLDVTMPATLASPWLLSTGAGNDSITLRGGGAQLSVDGGSGNDRIMLGDDGHRIDGGSGVDTAVFAGARAAYTVTGDAGACTVQSSGGADTLAGVERLQFADTTLALDIDGNAGQAYRLYQAAFNRAPDAQGLGFWIHYMDSGMTLAQAAELFMPSQEFRTLYGSNPSNADFVDKLYHNVLHRAGEAAGVQFWMDYLTTGGGTQAKVLAFFGESPENQAALIGTIGHGLTYTPYG